MPHTHQSTRTIGEFAAWIRDGVRVDQRDLAPPVKLADERAGTVMETS
ncbi:MAG TPA: hypothetical protein VMM17_02390 [Gemmatimonadaceae bacterium]|nr:hypothetical protein [Gemmatimonadaceae bacterium]